MPITLNGDTGITTPGLTNTGSTTLVSLTTTGNTILGDQSTDTLNVANGNLVLNSSGNLGIGTASPTNPLHIVSNTVSQLNVTALSGNTNAQINFEPTGTGIALIGPANNVAFAFRTNATERMRLDASGNLGIGTSSPLSPLDVVVGASGARRLLFNYDDSVITIKGANATPNPEALRFVADNFRFNTGTTGSGTEKMRLDLAGNLGLGVTPTSNSLGPVYQNKNAVFVADGSTPRFWLGSNWYNNSGDKYIVNGFASLYSQQSGQHIWWNAPTGTAGDAITFTQAMTLTAGGLLGVGVTSPEQRIHLPNSSGIRLGDAGATPKADINYSSAGFEFLDIKVQGTISGYGNIRFYTGSTPDERARIDSSGNLLVGATSSYTTYASIQVTGDNKGVAIRDSTDNSYRAIYNQSGTLYFWNGSNEGYLSSGGAWVNASDARLKSNIRNIEYGLSTVLATQPRHFERTDVEGTYIGFIAQELQLIIPEVVSGSEKQLGVDYGSLVALAFKAIQELKSELDSVKTELAALKGN